MFLHPPAVDNMTPVDARVPALSSNGSWEHSTDSALSGIADDDRAQARKCRARERQLKATVVSDHSVEEKRECEISKASSSRSSKGVSSKSEAALLVTGFRTRDVTQRLDGRYVNIDGRTQCGRAVFQKVPDENCTSGRGGLIAAIPPKPIVIYFWDDRDGWHLCGWWIGPEVGSNTVWAFNPGEADEPPVDGWRQPWYADVVARARVAAANADDDASQCSPPQLHTEAEEGQAIARSGAAEIAAKLEDVIKALRVPQALTQCVDCRGIVQSPCVLPCGHVVCLAHVENLPCSSPERLKIRSNKPMSAVSEGVGEQPGGSDAMLDSGTRAAGEDSTVIASEDTQQRPAGVLPAGIAGISSTSPAAGGEDPRRRSGANARSRGAEIRARRNRLAEVDLSTRPTNLSTRSTLPEAGEGTEQPQGTREVAREVALASMASFARATGVEVPTWLRSHAGTNGARISALPPSAGPRHTRADFAAHSILTRTGIGLPPHRAAMADRASMSRRFQRMSRSYYCPYSPACFAHGVSASAETKDWRPCGIVAQLLALAASFCPKAANSSSEVAEELASQGLRKRDQGQCRSTDGAVLQAEQVGLDGAVLQANTPGRLIAAYEKLGHANGSAKLHAAAAAAFSAAYCLHEAFFQASSSNTETGCAPAEFIGGVVHVQNVARVKAAAWSKRCGEEALRDATLTLPTPTLSHFASEVKEQTNLTIAALQKDKPAARQILDCPVCYRLLHQPVSTPCGHMFCRGCLARILDAGNGCPLCRGVLRGVIDLYAPCTALEVLEEALWPEEYAQRQKEAAMETLGGAGEDGQTEGRLAIYSPGNFLVPSQPAVVHVVEPRHRLLIRRALESGTRRFGMCLGPQEGDRETSHSLGFAEYGMELRIHSVQTLPNGRSLVDVVGGRRFRVVDAAQSDGYSIADVEFPDDAPEEDSAQVGTTIEEFFKELREMPDMFRIPMGSGAQDITGGEDPYPSLDDKAACDALGWTVLARIPAAPSAKYRCLSSASRQERFAAIIAIMRKLQAQEDYTRENGEEVSAPEASSHADAGADSEQGPEASSAPSSS